MTGRNLTDEEWDAGLARIANPNGTEPFTIVSFEDFAATAEPGAGALLGDADQALIPEDSNVVIYGDGGAGKTTLALDLAVHWAAGRDWLDITVQRPLTTLTIENEGPRPLLRAKLTRKLTGWDPAGRARIVEKPWAAFSFADEEHRQHLADIIAHDHLDAVIVGPVVCAGMEGPGTLYEVRAFIQFLDDVRHRAAGRRVTFILIHHENRAGKVSGAWEGAVDTLLHVSLEGPGRTRVYMQKARWASHWHGQTLHLTWADNESFQVLDKPEVTDDNIAEQLLTAVTANPGIGWSDLEKAVPGVRSERRRKVRDRLLEAGQLVNIGRIDGHAAWLTECPKGKRTQLHLANDPTIRQLRPDPDEVGTQSASAQGAFEFPTSSPRPVPSRDEVGDEVNAPSNPGRPQ
jgi:hypothetical protein